MIIDNGDNLVFVCYRTDKSSGLSLVNAIVDGFDEVKEFIEESRKDNFSYSVEPFIVHSLGSSFSREVPERIYNELIYNELKALEVNI